MVLGTRVISSTSLKVKVERTIGVNVGSNPSLGSLHRGFWFGLGENRPAFLRWGFFYTHTKNTHKNATST